MSYISSSETQLLARLKWVKLIKTTKIKAPRTRQSRPIKIDYYRYAETNFLEAPIFSRLRDLSFKLRSRSRSRREKSRPPGLRDRSFFWKSFFQKFVVTPGVPNPFISLFWTKTRKKKERFSKERPRPQAYVKLPGVQRCSSEAASISENPRLRNRWFFSQFFGGKLWSLRAVFLPTSSSFRAPFCVFLVPKEEKI